MAAKINGIIGEQGSDRVGPRIVQILGEELASQATLQTNPALAATVWYERVWPFETKELPAVNVTLARGDMSSRDMQGTAGEYTYNVDVECKAPTTPAANSDKLAAVYLQRMLGLFRAILENPVYDTLDFLPGLVERVFVRSLQVAAPREKNDAETILMGRIEFVVKVRETNNLVTPEQIASWHTTVKLSLTDKGYLWIANAEDAGGGSSQS